NNESAHALMERLQKKLGRFKPANIPVTLSIGVASLNHDRNDTLNSLFELADRAMYQAKMAGRNCVMTYDGHSGQET
ncbi:GGDEF domain-containing protein, partial [Methylophaga lonarensis]